MGRLIGIDYGTRRIGLATADTVLPIASPAAVLDATGQVADDAQRVAAWTRADPPAGLVVGLPLSMDGTDSAQTRLTRRFADVLGAALGVPVELWDERLTSFHADELLSAAAGKRRGRQPGRDAVAAQLILQAYLDAQRQPPASDEPQI